MALASSTLSMMTSRVVLLLLLSLAVCVFAARDLPEESASKLSAPQVPAAIEVPAGYKLHMVLFAKGSQYYKYNGTSWVSHSAWARLYDKQTKKEIGHHYYLPQPDALGGQPSWQTLSSKGVPYSVVTSVSVARASVSDDSILWVLLKTTQSRGDKGYLGDVAYVQRYNTYHGLSPVPTSGTHITGAVRKRSYTADYAFYVPES